MKIKKKNTTIPINGKVVDTENVDDKTSNAPSLRLVGEMIKENYSTEERAIGTWIDGKTLYRKVVSAKFGTVVQDTETTVEILLKDVNFVLVDKYWIDRITVANATNQGPNQDAIYQRYTSNSNNQSSIRFASKQSWASNLTVYAVIIYTKTTD